MTNFDKVTERAGTNSLKWGEGAEKLPMWVADMDFETAPAVTAALQQRLDRNVFGYNIVPESFQASIVDWWQAQHHLALEPDWIMYCTGVVPAISSIVRKITTVGDDVVLLTPVYNIFYNSILNNGRHVLESPMTYEEGQYAIDFTDLAEKLARATTTMLIFCNPQNPVGKIWDLATLKKVGDLCLQHHVVLLSDEIHCDLTHVGHAYVPMLSVSKEIAENTIVCVAPTKTFNIAGLQTSAIIVPNEALRQRVERGINTDEVAEPNSFAIQAAVAAFSAGAPWLADLKIYLQKNWRYLNEALVAQVPEIKVVAADATYLAWLDCSALTADGDELVRYLEKETGLILSAGSVYGGNSKAFVRWNYATQMARLEEGVARFVRGVQSYQIAQR